MVYAEIAAIDNVAVQIIRGLVLDTDKGSASRFGPSDHYDMLLDALVGMRIVVILVSSNGEQVKVSGINRGDLLEGDNGVTYPYTTYKVQRFL